MSYIRYKTNKNGKTYAYEVTSIWDSHKKQSRSKSKYLGAVDANKNILPKKIKQKTLCPKTTAAPYLIQDFGNGFLLKEFIKQTKVYKALSLFQTHPQLLILLAYRLCYPGAMHHCHTWLEGNVLQHEI